jgi:F-type H+-transporting ATPase subunit b
MNRLSGLLSSCRRLAMMPTVCTAIACWLVSATSFAAGSPSAHEAGGAHGAHDGITLFNWPSAEDPRIGLGYLVLNFVVLAFLIHRLILRKLVDDNVTRHDDIKRQVEDARRSLSEAEAGLADFKRRMDRVDAESKQILDVARKAADADRTRLLAEAEVEVERFKSQAMATAQREVSLRRAEIEAEVVDRAIVRAGELLMSRITDADQGRLVDDYAVELANNRVARA